MLVLFWARAAGRIIVAINAKVQQKARGNMMAQADEPRRRDETKVHHHHQRLAAGQATGIFSFERPISILQCLGSDVIHDHSPARLLVYRSAGLGPR